MPSLATSRRRAWADIKNARTLSHFGIICSMTRSPLPDWINVYYWVYPYQTQIVVRDCAYLDLRIGKPFVVWLLKFFPDCLSHIMERAAVFDQQLTDISSQELGHY